MSRSVEKAGKELARGAEFYAQPIHVRVRQLLDEGYIKSDVARMLRIPPGRVRRLSQYAPDKEPQANTP